METLATINKGETEPKDYITRLTVKAVVTNETGSIAIYSGLLLGGGVEGGETIEQALHRECLEEAGVTIEIIKPLGKVIQYRDEFKKRYEVHGFLARVTAHDLPTTKQEDEVGKTVEWVSVDEARNIFEKRIGELEVAEGVDRTKDSYQGKFYNTKTALIFLNEAAQ